jgi:hypothetical protein
LKIRALLVFLPLLGGCATQLPGTETLYSPCKALATRDWTAHVEVQPQGVLWDPDDPALVVSGTVEVPSGGYELSIHSGGLMRLEPPVQQVILRTTPPEGMASQAITEQRVTGAVPWDGRAKSVSIRCGDGTIASIPVIEDRRGAEKGR